MKFIRKFFDGFSFEFNDNVWKILVFLLTLLILSTILTSVLGELANPTIHYKQGEVAGYTYRAPRDFLIEDTLNTEKRRAEALAEVPIVFARNSNSIKELPTQFESMLASLQKLSALNVETESEQLLAAKSAFERQFSVDFIGKEWEVLLNRSLWVPLEASVASLLKPLLRTGIISNRSRLDKAIRDNRRAVIWEIPLKVEKEISSLRPFYDMQEALEVAETKFPVGGFGHGPAFDSVVKKLTRRYLKPNVLFDPDETNKRNQIAQASIEPIFYRIKRNQVIVREGELITPTQELRLRKLREESKSKDLFKSWLGYVVFSALILFSVFAFTVNFWPGCHFTARDLGIGSITLIGSFFLIKLFSVLGSSLSAAFFYFDSSTFILAAPVAAGGVLLQVTLGAPAVFMFLLSFALLSGVFLENSWIILALIVVGNIVGAISVKTCSRRSAFILAGIRVAAVNMLIVLCFVLLYPEFTAVETANRLLWAIVGGLASGILGAGLTPIAEFIGGYVTDIKLLELASLDHPLLRELSVQAPGTWNHSMVLGQMGEAAAESIDANPLLTRVGAYYHDIGKAKKPAYFVENQNKENRHDKLTPSMSALIIKTHVKDGIEMARQHRLPRSIIDFIPQHHGTGLIKYFYTKALGEAEEEDEVAEAHYRYAGPRPQNKEAAILLLADSVEASSRTLSDPTPAKIQGLVQKIINNIFASGELDESSLTLKELHMIAKSFTRVLNGIYHRRIEYSEPAEKIREIKNGKQQKTLPQVFENGQTNNEAEEGQKKNGSRAANQTNGGKKPGESTSDTPGSKEALKRLGI